ncbi:hypothetical protein SAMN04488541_101731 [Thermoflexibacter ruber]|uniref:Uncharacterized protein n=1 Tax=Thermoflexibacter ruber TaxID=1003 RepID=A0A1I2G9A1_9BACT|nr:hypothetical protein SAMN04488541_101731 [Thermoflexibacter ruber]
MKKIISMLQISNFLMNQKYSTYFYLEKPKYLFLFSKKATHQKI